MFCSLLDRGYNKKLKTIYTGEFTMTDLQKNINDYLDDCRYMKGLSSKTLKAYSIDLRQFSEFCTEECIKSLYYVLKIRFPYKTTIDIYMNFII